MMSFSNLIQADLQRIPRGLGIHEALAGRHVLLTGATGFFGLWLLALLSQLNREGAAIHVSVTSRNPSRFLDVYSEYRECTWLSWLSGDIRELRSVPGSPVGLILHAAADTSAVAHARPLELFNTITEGSRRLFELAIRCGAERVLIVGSGAQYGNLPEDAGVTEDHQGACLSHIVSSAYGEGKRVQETLAALYAECHGLSIIMTRCFTFSGPGLPLDGHFAIGNFVRDALFADEVVLNSSGRAVRSYLHGGDLAAWLLTLLGRGESGRVYNVGSDQAVSIEALARRVIDRVSPGKPVRILGADSERSFYVPDISRAREIGLDIWTSLDASIDSMAEWAKNDVRGV